MRILYLTSRFPFPLTHGGNVRQFWFVRELSRSHSISLLSLDDGYYRPGDSRELEGFTERAVVVENPPRSRALWRRVARRSPIALSAGIGDPAVTEMRAAAARLHADRPFDAVVLSGLRTAPVAAALPGVPVVADVCDAISELIRTRMSFVGRRQVPQLWLDWLQVRRSEQRLRARADRLLFAAARDRDAVMGPGAGARGLVVPTCVEIDRWQRSTQELGRRTVVFVGAMGYRPNEDAAAYLIESIWPRVRAQVPDAHLFLVGRDPSPRLSELGRAPGVTVTGPVPEVAPYLERASVFAAPVRWGAGIQTKLLEALAMELPAVATPFAAEGLRTDDGRPPPVAVADGPDAFAARLVERLRTAEPGAAPHRRGREFVAEHFQWSRSGKLLEQAVLEATTTA